MATVVIALYLAAVAIEAFCMIKGVPAYERYGLTVYATPSDLQRSSIDNNRAFRPIDGETFAFRGPLLFRGTVRFGEDATVTGFIPYSTVLPFLLVVDHPWWVAGFTLVNVIALVVFYRQLDTLAYKV